MFWGGVGSYTEQHGYRGPPSPSAHSSGRSRISHMGCQLQKWLCFKNDLCWNEIVWTLRRACYALYHLAITGGAKFNDNHTPNYLELLRQHKFNYNYMPKCVKLRLSEWPDEKGLICVQKCSGVGMVGRSDIHSNLVIEAHHHCLHSTAWQLLGITEGAKFNYNHTPNYLELLRKPNSIITTHLITWNYQGNTFNYNHTPECVKLRLGSFLLSTERET